MNCPVVFCGLQKMFFVVVIIRSRTKEHHKYENLH